MPTWSDNMVLDESRPWAAWTFERLICLGPGSIVLTLRYTAYKMASVTQQVADSATPSKTAPRVLLGEVGSFVMKTHYI